MNMREYEIVKGFNEKLKDYPEYIQTIMGDLNDYVDTLGTRVVDVENYMAIFADTGNSFNKLIVDRYNDFLTDEIDDTDLCILTISGERSFVNTDYYRMVELLNLLGFVNIDIRFGVPNTKIFLYTRNNTGEEYFNAIRHIVFTFFDNYDKIGV